MDENGASAAPEEHAHTASGGKVTRRQALGLGAGAAAALAMGRSAQDDEREERLAALEGVDPTQDVLVNGRPIQTTHIAHVPESRGSFPNTMRVMMADGTIIDDESGVFLERSVRVRTYNGTFPGPTASYKAGDAITFTLENTLAPDPHPSRDLQGNIVPRWPWYTWSDSRLGRANVPHGFNVTNIHTHGLHVSPGTNHATNESSDDVHVQTTPWGYPYGPDSDKGSRRYRVQLPEFHAPGTHWYHAHIHGSTALQVANGLAGGLIVEEPEAEKMRTTDGRVIRDDVFLIQEISGQGLDYRLYGNMRIAGDNRPPPPDPQSGAIYGGKPDDKKPILFSVNGKGHLLYDMVGGEFRRFRVINGTGTPRGFMGLDIIDGGGAKQPFYHVATDGITHYGKSLASLRKFEIKMIEPGGRVDILVQLRPGDYQFRKLARVIRSGTTSTGPTKTENLMKIKVTNAIPDQRLPVALPPLPAKYCYLRPITEPVDVQRTMQFAVKSAPAKFGDFSISVSPPDAPGATPQPYGNPQGIPPSVVVKLNTVEQWRITNSSGAAHPFHIHVNPFQVVEADKPPSEWVWRDTVMVPAKGEVTIRTRYLNYPGKFVIHCHVLAHEDAGMMWNVDVLGQGAGPGQRLARCTCLTCLGSSAAPDSGGTSFEVPDPKPG